MIKWDLFQGCQDGSISAKPINAKHCTNQRKDKYHVIITIHKEETFDKIYHPFMSNSLNKVGM